MISESIGSSTVGREIRNGDMKELKGVKQSTSLAIMSTTFFASTVGVRALHGGSATAAVNAVLLH